MLIRQLSRLKVHRFALCLVLSIVVHSLALCGVRMFGHYRFGVAVGEAPVMVTLADPSHDATSEAQEPAPPEAPDEAAPPSDAPAVPAQLAAGRQEEAPAAPPAAEGSDDPASKGSSEPEPDLPEAPAAAPGRVATAEPLKEPPVAENPSPSALPVEPPSGAGSAARKGGEFLAAKEERLTYLVSMLGVPIGRAELEARNGERGTTITLRVRSNPATSGIYPVDDLVETQHVDGRFVMTRIRQREGDFRSDEAFSINLEQKRVSWTDNIHFRNLKVSVPTGEVLDTLSGIYSLRKRALQVGKTEMLHIFDSEKYAQVPVEILRREEMRLPNLAKVHALVVRPEQKTAGIFRRTGDVLIWFTDDDAKVPVKIVTTIALGKVTAELVSAESQPRDPGAQERRVD